MDTEVEIGEISGEMTLPEDFQTTWIIITGGIGIVPYISMFREIKEKSLPYKITLVYSNTKESWAIFMDELESFVLENPNFNFIPTMTQDPNWAGEKRALDEQFLKEKLENPEENLYYISGTPRFVPSIVNAIKALGVPPEKMKFEIFIGY